MKNNAPEWATHVAERIDKDFTYPKAYVKKEGGNYLNDDNIIYVKDNWTFTPIERIESVYTQEMKNNGERVKVGMKFKVGGSIYTAGLIGDSVVACIQDGMIITADLRYIEPIVSEREEAEAKQIDDCYAEYIKGYGSHPVKYANYVKTNLKRLQKAGLLAEIILPLKRS